MSDKPQICRKCGATIRPGIAMQSTMVGEPEWPGDTLATMSPGGPGKLIECLKCPECGWSVSA